jgi:hypothetical protein
VYTPIEIGTNCSVGDNAHPSTSSPSFAIIVTIAAFIVSQMADVFISYSKADHDLALNLSALLEAEGWSVWWDKSLKSGDEYRDDIMRELAAARVVIAIWTAHSIESDWVRAEAGRAKADGKLIPVKASALTYDDIPLPFGEMHTENITRPELIKAAVVAKLAKPAVAPSAFWVATKTLRLQALTWTGIIGGAITLFTSAKGLLDLANWARWLVTRWQDWSHAFWAWLFGWVGIRIKPDVVPLMSFVAFVIALSIGVRLSTEIMQPIPADRERDRTRLRHFVIATALYYGVPPILFMLGAAVAALGKFMSEYGLFIREEILSIIVLLYIAFIWSWLVAFPFTFLMLVAKRKWPVFVASTLYMIFSVILFMVPTVQTIIRPEIPVGDLALAPILLIMAPVLILQPLLLAIVSFAPPRQLAARLSFLAIGLALLIFLNELSRLNLRQNLQP